jgi:hypothetical protein
MRSDPAASFAYYGEREGWLIVLSQHRDSDALERSNWDVITADMLARFPDDAAIERQNHWAVGWTETLLVRPGSPALAAAEGWTAKLADYPVADEEAFSELEWSEEWCVRCDRGTRAQHGEGWDNFRSSDDADDIVRRWQDRADYRDGRAWGRAYGDRPSPYIGASIAWSRGYADGMAPDMTSAAAWLARWGAEA